MTYIEGPFQQIIYDKFCLFFYKIGSEKKNVTQGRRNYFEKDKFENFDNFVHKLYLWIQNLFLSNQSGSSQILCGNSQDYLRKFVRFFVTLGLKMLRLLRQKVVIEAYVIKR